MEDRVALVSGASRGIGRAIADRLAADGWRLSLGLRTPSGLADDERVQTVRYDAGAGGEAEWVSAALARFGRIDAIVANAGIIVPKTVIEGSDEELDAMWQVNVKAPRRLAQAAFPALAASGRGRIIITASLSGKRVKSPASGLYAITKHAAVALAHALRQTGFDQGIRATAICPGFVATDMARGLTARGEADMTRAEDVAALVAMALDLPNTASVAELAVNCQAEELY
ncbi:MAG: SDR family NAD(P)-dependent oxidoreductase [Amaricoccus sp.]|uniref:SDR family NAD(P)-dependent oxidoreductase n=1 Tax=Amaricoccus sp. TaxID=1872485 RepID=UPI0039E6C49F